MKANSVMADPDQSEKVSELRKRAEQLVEEQLSGNTFFSPEETQKIIQDLHVHQIELELQNEELRLTQLELESARRKYTDLYEFSPVGLLTLDNYGCIEETNLTFVRQMGMNREKLVKQHLSDFMDRSSQDVYHIFFQSLRSNQQPQTCDIRLLAVNQIPLSIRLDGVVMAQDGVQPTYRLAVTDITERQQAQVERARLFTAEQVARTQAEQSLQRIANLQHLTAALSEAATPQQVGDVILRQGLALRGAHAVSLAFLTEDQQGLEFFRLAGFPNDVVQEYQRIALADPLPLSDAVRTQQPVWLGNLQVYQEHYPQLIPNVRSRTDTQAIACIPLSVKGRKIGGMGIGFAQPQVFSEEDKTFILALAGQCVLALDRAEQAQEIAAVQARQWIARELHDSVTQSLFSALLMTDSLPRMWDEHPEAARRQTNEVVLIIRGAMAEMRTLLIQLLPETIVRTKLPELLKQLGNAARSRKILELILELEESGQKIPPATHIAIYRIAQESITNVIKHSHATQLRIRLHYQSEQITLQVEDNGQGFDVAQLSSGLGQTSLRERAKAIDAILMIDSELGKGTRITLVWKPPSSTNSQ